jgi:hypothetical protein
MVIGRRHCEDYFGIAICEIVTERASLAMKVEALTTTFHVTMATERPINCAAK